MEKIIYKNIQIDLDQKLCYVLEEPVELSRTEFTLLLFLINNSNKVFSRRELLNEVWKSKVSLRTVDTTISRLRKKLGICSNYLITRLGFGYGLS